MATIGIFNQTENGFTGTVKTLSLNVKTVKFIPAEGDNERGPDFRIFAGAELDAAWQKTAKDTERDWFSVKLDDPSFPAPIEGTLIDVEGQEGLQLIWSRPSHHRPRLRRPRQSTRGRLIIASDAAPDLVWRRLLVARSFHSRRGLRRITANERFN